jgi:hypothetical protein
MTNDQIPMTKGVFCAICSAVACVVEVGALIATTQANAGPIGRTRVHRGLVIGTLVTGH